MTRSPIVVDDTYRKAVEGARRLLRALTFQNQCAPIMLRLAWHDAGTYEASTKTGGPNGSMRFELHHQANAGLEYAINLCEEVKRTHAVLTYADIYQLAGVVAVEITGGPSIEFIPGRKDSHNFVPEGRLPDANQGAEHLREVFNRMGLSDKDIVALSGAHTLGRAHLERSGSDGAWTKQPLKFDNSYFKELLKKQDEQDELLRFPTDNCLVTDEKFIDYVRKYAGDEEAFFQDYAESHKRLSELGCRESNPAFAALSEGSSCVNKTAAMVQGAFGIVIATGAVLLGYFYDFRK